jgi:hypothetical protein
MKLFPGSSFSFSREGQRLITPGQQLPNILAHAAGIDWMAK